MSEPKLISPMLDGFVMGGPISDHHGVQCCPAMRAATDDKYIVKILSIPASQVQAEALLISGAFSDREAVSAYFRSLCQDVTAEAELLQQLSRLEGYTPFESWQTVPKEGEMGCDVYLLGSYKRTLRRFMDRTPMTQLGAVNLGLDICAALAVARRAGWLYADLKPENIYVFDEQTYRIGDLGFVKLDSLKYASLPDRCRSEYTAPEVADVYAVLNTTLDIYALGMILYRIYNDDKLPEAQDGTPEPPMYADYEMSEIILRAIDPDPEKRWQDPMDMGQALVDYMQRNRVNSVPIVPLAPEPEVSAEAPLPEAAEESAPEAQPEEAAGEAVEDAAGEAAEEAAEEPAEEAAAEPAEDFAEDAAGEAADSDDLTDLSFLDAMTDDETAPNEDAVAALEDAEVSGEVSEMLAKANELIAHETPEGVVAPEPIDIPMPQPIVLPADEDAPGAAAEEEASGEEPSDESGAPEVPEAAEEAADGAAQEADEAADEEVPVPRKKRRWLIWVLVLVLVAGLGIGSWFFYNDYYMQDVNIHGIEGTGADLTLLVETEAEEGTLTLVLTDTYGNTHSAPVESGKAAFTGLSPSTQYTASARIEGFHGVRSSGTVTFTTAPRIIIEDLAAKTGPEDGSVILTYTVNGNEPKSGWTVTCTAEGEQDIITTLQGHHATISGLTVGKEYTFRLSTEDVVEVTGTTELTWTASNVILAQDLSIDAFADGNLTVSWSAPEGITVEEWTVRCYSDTGYDTTLTVADVTAVFPNVDASAAHTVEVTASGMTQFAAMTMSADPIVITGVLPQRTGSRLDLSWTFDGSAPEGWVLSYHLEGSESITVINAAEAAVQLHPLVPGCTYVFTLEPSDDTTLFGGSFTYECPEAEAFRDYGIAANELTFRMLKQPKANWDYNDGKRGPFTNTFSAGTKVSFLVTLSHWQDRSGDAIEVLYVFRDSDGMPVHTATANTVWNNMWDNGYCCLDIPSIPAAAGEYTVEVYFNSFRVTAQSLTVR